MPAVADAPLRQCATCCDEDAASPTETDPLVGSSCGGRGSSATASAFVACLTAGGIFCLGPVPTCLVVFTEKKITADPTGFASSIVGSAQSLFYLGWSLSAVLVLPLSDRIGRKPVLSMLVPVGLFGVVCSLMAKDMVTFEASLFTIGLLATAGQVAFVLALESVPSSWRSQATVGINSAWSMVLIFMALACEYETSDLPWRTETAVWYAPFAVLMLLTAAFVKETLNPRQKTGNEEGQAQSSGRKLFNEEYCRTTVCTCWTWVAASLAFYGLTFASGNLSPNPYLNVALFGVVDVVSAFLGGMAMESLGPTLVQCISFGMSGVVLLGISVLREGSVLMIPGALLGRLAIDVAFMAIFRLVVEHFPMDCRATAMGLGNFVGRIAAMAAPFCMVLPTSLTCSLMGLVCICGALASHFLPPVGPTPGEPRFPQKAADNKALA